MRTLPCPTRELTRDHLVRALEPYQSKGVQRGYAATAEQLDQILSIYDAYDVTIGAPGEALKGPALPDALRGALHNGYEFTQIGRKLACVRVDLMSGIELCPICGISAPRELDHHLPRSAYHPLAIYVRNLVPLCHDCNHSKSKAEAEDPAQRFIHPYLEELPDIDFVRAMVAIENGGLSVSYDIDPAAPLEALTRERLAYVVQRLKLNERYLREINIYLTGQATAMRMSFEWGGADMLRTYLLTQMGVEIGQFHRNHWRPALLRALAAHEAFCGGGFQAVLP